VTKHDQSKTINKFNNRVKQTILEMSSSQHKQLVTV